MPPAIIAGGIAAVGAIGGAVISSKSQSKAANQANDAQQVAADQRAALARESMALNTGIYNSNYNTLSPWVSRGNVAGDAYSAMLGLPAAPQMTSPMGAANALSPTTSPVSPLPAPTSGLPSTRAALMASTSPQASTPTMSIASPLPVMRTLPGITGGGTANALSMDPDHPLRPAYATAALARAQATRDGLAGESPAPGATPVPMPGTAAPATTPATAASAFQNFADSAGMKFQLEQGANALNNLYAAKGQVQSGAAAKALQSFGQNTALQNFFMPYMNMVNGVSQQGLGAASSIAGVGTSFGNTAANINGQIGGAYQNSADAAANAAIARGYGQAQMWNTVGNQIGNVASSFVPRPY
jgi:hypothetical protein